MTCVKEKESQISVNFSFRFVSRISSSFFPLHFPSLSLPPNSVQFFFFLCDTWRCRQWRIRAPTRFSPRFSTLSSDADDLHDYRTVLYRLPHEYLLLRPRFKVLSSLSISIRFFRCLCSEFQQ